MGSIRALGAARGPQTRGRAPDVDKCEEDVLMRKMLIAGVAALSLAGCTAQERAAGTGAAIGGVGGAIVGAAASGGKAGATLAGAAIGATAGALVGAVGASRPGYCYYRDSYGERYVDRCPEGY